MGWTMQQPRPRHLLLLFLAFVSCVTVVFISKSADTRDDRGSVAYRLAEMDMRLDRIARLYDLKEDQAQHLIGRFGSALRTVVRLLNESVVVDQQLLQESLMTVEMVGSPLMPRFDVFTFLPHLRTADGRDRLRPSVLHSGGRHAVSMVFGVPTVRRQQQTYLIQTLTNLVSNMNRTEQDDSLIVVMIGEIDQEYTRQVADDIKNRLPDAFESGLIDVIAPSPEYYPDLGKLRLTLGDSEERVRWRSKQNLDYAFLMMYCQPKGSFYVQLEDDVVAKPQFHTVMKTTALRRTVDGQRWFVLDFCRLGFIGKMMRCSDLPWLIQFIVMFYNDKPGDWLLDGMMETKACNLEKDQRDCRKRKDEIWVTFRPSLFQHIGTRSSLNGKIQLLKDGLFKKNGNVKRINKMTRGK